MLSKVSRITWSFLIIIGLIGVLPAATLAAPPHQEGVACEQEYTVESGDWLSRIAEETYGDPTAYPAIVQATNAQETGDFATIDDPGAIEVGWTLCLPNQEDAQAMLGETGQMMMEEEMAEAEEELTAPEGQMLMVVRNISKELAPSTFTISGGEYGGGEQITVDSGEEMELNLNPGDYRVVWTSPEAEDIAFARDFTAIPGTVARARIVPEKEQAFFNFNVNQEEVPEEQAQQMAQQEAKPEEQLTPSQNQMLMVVKNASKELAPSTFTISGGEYGGGEQITVDSGEDVVLNLMPGDYRVTWSSPEAELTFARSFTAVPGTVSRARIVPEKEQVSFRFQVRQGETEEAEMEQPEPTETMAATEQRFEAPQDEMLMVVRNISKELKPSTFTISGGEFGGGEQMIIDSGEENVLKLMPGDYRVIWSTPAAGAVAFGRSFTAVPETVAMARIIPEKEQVFFRFNVNEEQMEQAQAQMEEAGEAAETEIDREFPFQPPEGRGMLVAGNRSKEQIPSTLTITGGRFGGGEQITVNPDDQVFLPVDPGTLTLVWTAPVDENEDAGQSAIVSREVEIAAGESPLIWVVPEEFRAFMQPMGEEPTELAQ